MIKPVNGKFILFTKDGRRILGVHKSEKKAKAQERAIYASQAQRGKR